MLKNFFKRFASAQDWERADQLLLEGNQHEDAGQLDAAVRLYQEAVRDAPTMPKAYLNLGIGLAAQGQEASAMAAFQAGLELAPAEPFLNFNCARLLYAQGDYARARDLAQRAIAAKKDFASAHVLLSNVLDELGMLAPALDAIDTAMTIPPSLVGTHLNRVRLLIQQLRAAEAIDAATAALAIWPEDAELHWNLAFALLLLGQFETGWQEHEWRSSAGASSMPDFGLPRWDSRQHSSGRSVLLFAEQGLGDSIQFLRYVPLVAQRFAQVALLLPESLCELARASLPSNCVVVGDGPAPPPCEFQCPLLSLPLALGSGAQLLPRNVPYLAADPQRVGVWRDRLKQGGRRLSVGLVWSGNPAHKNDRNRSMPLKLLQALGALGCRLVSLQPEIRESDRQVAAQWPQLEQWGGELRDFRDTAALVEALDLVVSVDTSVAHLAGSLGRPVWILLPYSPDWRWMLEREDSPWYPSARLYRQPKAGDWVAVVTRVAADLKLEIPRTRVPADVAEE